MDYNITLKSNEKYILLLPYPYILFHCELQNLRYLLNIFDKFNSNVSFQNMDERLEHVKVWDVKIHDVLLSGCNIS